MVKLFARYASVGVINTLIHWVAFTVLYTEGQSQSLSNFAAFCIAVTFSFFANAKWTFSAEATTFRYLLYIFFMGGMASAVGLYADRNHSNPVITLVVFSAMSLVCGFIYSRFVVFKDRK
ncbi:MULTISPECIES: GtrA family protein [Pantoea]|jgi:putative flippase GtrA|uniref:GtrA family protein n=1 Tax=Pantoea TaxID=53335 RepID=UPI000EA26B2C|nr:MULTISPECIES: GtrA family protein [Pantoea]MBZ6388545.1 GtrA family protein [Pantoea piersonii]MBZ6402275.1 GtrA family protein [Pantoea piersonii]MBZ6410526.1 GtrA family protein [Pantoea piersonii]MBZ6427404.1 GtrA family protein [Pantoea piersonii]NYB02314.1 GtrA family protein [Pantoea piersonii]